MGRKYLIILSLTVIILSIAAAGCNNKVDAEIISFTDAAMENVLVSLNERDFESYIKDMDEEMLKVITKDSFEKFSAYLKDTIGEYRQDSKEYVDSYIQSGFYVVIYNANYTDEPENVIVKAVISAKGEGIYQISGTWFDSPKLRETGYEE
jgi:hypothetical protein